MIMFNLSNEIETRHGLCVGELGHITDDMWIFVLLKSSKK